MGTFACEECDYITESEKDLEGSACPLCGCLLYEETGVDALDDESIYNDESEFEEEEDEIS